MLFRLLAYLWLVVTLYVLLKPGVGFEQHVFFPHEDKVAHFGLFLNLTLLWHRELVVNFNMDERKSLIIIALLGTIMGGLTELIQLYIPQRGMDFMDFAFNLMGIGTGVFFYLILQKTNQTLFK